MARSLPLILVFVGGLWVIIFTGASHLGGWASLARNYSYPDKFSGDRWRFQSAQMRWFMGYNNCLTIGANAEGLYLSILFPFRFAHPPLFIPWREISVIPRKILWIRFVELRLGRELAMPLRIRERLAQKLKNAAGASWPAETVT